MLVELTERHPAEVGECLRLMIERIGTADGYAYFLGRDGLRTALVRLKEAQAGRDIANSLINKLIALGILEFLDLVAPQVPAAPPIDSPQD